MPAVVELIFNLNLTRREDFDVDFRRSLVATADLSNLGGRATGQIEHSRGTECQTCTGIKQ